eukprot:6224890-Prymnesium_polylepis.1
MENGIEAKPSLISFVAARLTNALKTARWSWSSASARSETVSRIDIEMLSVLFINLPYKMSQR